MSRWKTLRRNTSRGDRIRLGLLALVFVGLCVVAVLRPEGKLVLGAALLGFWLPWPLRHQIVEHCDTVCSLLKLFGFALIALSLAGNFVQRMIPEGYEMSFALALFAILGLYTGVYFWLFSDSRIERL